MTPARNRHASQLSTSRLSQESQGEMKSHISNRELSTRVRELLKVSNVKKAPMSRSIERFQKQRELINNTVQARAIEKSLPNNPYISYDSTPAVANLKNNFVGTANNYSEEKIEPLLVQENAWQNQTQVNMDYKSAKARSCLALSRQGDRGFQTVRNNLSVADYIKGSFKKRKTSELMYQPTDSIIKSKILPWGKLPTKDCFLDEVVKADQKNQKLSPGQYKGHDQWSQKLNSVAVNGHIRKGQFRPHDRKLEAEELIHKVKREGLPAPGAYNP